MKRVLPNLVLLTALSMCGPDAGRQAEAGGGAPNATDLSIENGTQTVWTHMTLRQLPSGIHVRIPLDIAAGASDVVTTIPAGRYRLVLRGQDRRTNQARTYEVQDLSVWGIAFSLKLRSW